MGDSTRNPFPCPDREVEFLQIAEGVYWLYMDKSYSHGINNTNIWLLEDTEGWFMVDAGMYTEKSLSLWEKLLAQPFKGKGIRQLLVTHFHPDHIGMAGWLLEHTSAEMLMTREEYVLGAYLYADANGLYNELARAYYTKHGMDEAALSAFGKDNAYRNLVCGLPKAFTDLTRSRSLNIAGREWEIIICSGHSYAHICLFSPELNLLLGGDQVMQNRAPSLMLPVFDQSYDPLAQYLRALDALSRLPKDVLVLPTHGLPYAGLHEQIDWVKGYHEERLHLILQSTGRSFQAWDVFRLIYDKPMRGMRLKFAFEECMAHLIYLNNRGVIKAEHHTVCQFIKDDEVQAYESIS